MNITDLGQGLCEVFRSDLGQGLCEVYPVCEVFTSDLVQGVCEVYLGQGVGLLGLGASEGGV